MRYMHVKIHNHVYNLYKNIKLYPNKTENIHVICHKNSLKSKKKHEHFDKIK